MKHIYGRTLLILIAAALVPACGGGGGGGGTTAASGGGNATGSSTPGAAFGGNGGTIEIFSTGNIFVGVNPAPQAPSLPQVPTAGTVVTTATLAGGDYTQTNGNILISGSGVMTDGSGSLAITALGGHIVISGSLLAADGGGGPDDIFLAAPNGTVYITGSVRTAGAAAGDTAGDLGIDARQIILTGSIDATGTANAAGDGGEGGDVAMSTTPLAGFSVGSDILIVGGTIDASGGSGTTNVSGTASDAGDIFAIAGGQIRVHSSLIARGGSVSGTADDLVSGLGGSVILEGIGGVALDANVTTSGGDVSTTGTGAVAGDAGPLGVNVFLSSVGPGPLGPVEIYGRYTGKGGSANATSGTVGQPIVAGNGGTVATGLPDFAGSGTVTAPSAVDMARANWNLSGGDSSDQAGAGASSGGGFVGIQALANDYIQANTPVAGRGNVRFKGTIDATNGKGVNDSAGEPALVFVTSQGDIVLEGTIKAGGGSAANDISASPPVPVPFGPGIRVEAIVGVNGDPNEFGSIVSSADIIANGADSTDGDGGPGGLIELECNTATGSVTVEPGSLLRVNGGKGAVNGDGGAGGLVLLVTTDQFVFASARIEARGGATSTTGTGTGGAGGQVVVHSDSDANDVGGDILIAAATVIDASAGAGAIGGDAANDGGGGATSTMAAVEFDADNDLGVNNDAASAGNITNLGTIIARGGNPDGAGGDVLFDDDTGSASSGPIAPDLTGPGGTDGDFVGQ